MTILRLALGLSFLLHGLQKMQMGLDKVGGFFASLGLPSFLAYPVGYIELIGGALLILGLFSRYIAAAFGVVMVGAIFTAKLKGGYVGGMELEVLLLAMSAYFAISGQSGYGLSSVLSGDKKDPVTL
ncbi:DoxX family protein [Tumebacillus sp. DT12]|uniref:DoxX family protein n=2 Tax=Tumebacillus lacus TaxID=2995335 RepID=A0ABT3WYF1_9BACL|nr:DoxX family protein [Tumebacillus lacus]